MVWAIPILATAGLFLSAFFSGSETGFYRATRLRLLLDALGGDRIAAALHWLTRNPSIFVATTLVGNNLANYITSLSIVMATHAVMASTHLLDVGGSRTAELTAAMIVPLALAPVLFVYGELLPKHLFLQAPNRLLRLGGPLFLVFVVLFFPISVLLFLLNRLLAALVGRTPEQVRSTLARRELQGVLEEGHEAGILHPAQRRLAQGIFTVAQRPVGQFATPLDRLPRGRADMSKDDILRLARRYRISVVPIEREGEGEKLIGYVRVIELGLSESAEIGPPHRLLQIDEKTSHIDALTQMQAAEESLARVVDSQKRTIGIVTADRLREPLLRGELAIDGSPTTG